ncbi:MAG: hypothetical protein WAV90_19175 [Gordonia amarae]
MSNALGVLHRAATDNGWQVATSPASGGLGRVEYDKGTSAATLVWNIDGKYADSVTVNGQELHGSGALISLRKFLEGDPSWDAPSSAIEDAGKRAWYAGS